MLQALSKTHRYKCNTHAQREQMFADKNVKKQFETQFQTAGMKATLIMGHL